MARKEAVFKMKLDSDDAVNDVKKLDKDFTHLADTIGTDVSGSISAMEDRLYELALQGDRTSDEFRDLQKRTAEYRKIVIETDRSIDALAEQGRGLSTALGIAEGTVAGFQAFTGVTAVLGDENEELLETITKLQAAQGVLNSIEVIKQQIQNNSIRITQAQTAVQKALNVAVGNGSKAMKTFRGALLATGIGAIVVAVGALIANFDKLRNMISGTTEAKRLNNKVTDTAIENAAEELSALDLLQRKINDENLTREEKNRAVKELQEQYPNLLSNIDAEASTTEELNRAIELNTKLVTLQAKLKATQELRVETYKELIKEETEALRGNNAGILEYTQALLFNTNAQAEANQQTKENIKDKNEELSLLDNLNNSLEREIALTKNSLGLKEQQKEAEKEVVETRKESQKQIREELQEISMLDVRVINQVKDTNDNLAKENEELMFRLLRNRVRYNDQLALKNEEAAKKELEQARQVEEAKNDIRSKAFNAATNLVELFTTKSEASQKKAFKITKGINIAQTIQSGLQGVINALSAKSVLPEPIASIQKGVTAASIAATTALNVKKIKATTFQGSGGGSIGGGSSPSIGGASANTFSIGDNTNANTTDLNPDGTINNGGGQFAPQKVYVTEQDITNTQNKVKATEMISSF